jgi:hypothetical protein
MPELPPSRGWGWGREISRDRLNIQITTQSKENKDGSEWRLPGLDGKRVILYLCFENRFHFLERLFHSMAFSPALDIRIYVTEWGDVRIETPHWRHTLPPADFVRWLRSARSDRPRAVNPARLPNGLRRESGR